jgi:thiamine-phosphate pyrophosphorylase
MDGAGPGPAEQIGAAVRAGIRLVQLRMKDASDAEFLDVAREAKDVCDAQGCMLIINDRVEIAVEVDAHGVHVGREDLPVREARRVLGEGKIVGGTANTFGDIREHFEGGADYVGLGPYRYTTTKKKLSPVLGLYGYREVMRELKAAGMAIPVMAIGGIGVEDVRGLVEAGVYGVAFSGALVRAEDRPGVVRAMESEVGENNKTI